MTARRQTVLVTGSAGHIGRIAVAALLGAGHRVRGFDRVAHATLSDQIVADLTDTDAVRRAVADVDQVVHLAAHPTTADFAGVLLPANVEGAYRVVSAAVDAGVRRLILASSVQVIGSAWMDGPWPVGVDVAAPTKEYGLTKLWLEHLGQMVARRHGVEVIAARIGWCVRNNTERQTIERDAKWQGLYIAPSDAAAFFVRAVDTPRLEAPGGYATVYAVGPGTETHPCPVDLEPGRRLLGFEPYVAWPAEAPPP